MTGKRDIGCGGFVPISYLDAAGSAGCPEGYAVCFRARPQREWLSGAAIHANDVRRMIEAAAEDAGLPEQLSPHSFRVTTTDLLGQGVPLEDVQRLAGHADPRTTRLCDRRSPDLFHNG
jgi:integrase/recombinase XerD